MQIQANLDFLRAERFRFWRPDEDGVAVTLQDYRGLALATGDERDRRLLDGLLRENAERWLAPCLRRANPARWRLCDALASGVFAKPELRILPSRAEPCAPARDRGQERVFSAGAAAKRVLDEMNTT